MNLMMKIKFAINQPIFKLGAPDFAWWWSREYLEDDTNDDDDKDNDDGDNDGDDDDKHDDEDQNDQNSANFWARNPKFCVVVDLDNTKRWWQ